MNPAIAMPEAPRKGRGRLQLLLILAITVGPMFLASAMYQWRFWVPETRSYHGVLIGDGRSLAVSICRYAVGSYRRADHRYGLGRPDAARRHVGFDGVG